MATSGFPICSADGIVESSMSLLASQGGGERSPRPGRRQRLRDATRILRRVSARRMMREPSMIVRETAAEQLEERQSDWAYSKPVVVLDILWNFTFVVAATVFMVLSWGESPKMPLRVWIVGYALQCALHMVFVCIEYQRRRRLGSERGGTFSRSSSGTQYVSLMQFEEDNTSSASKYLESANTMFSFIWWIIGFYWVSVGGEALVHDSPQLYWLCIIFLAFDVFFIVFCLALACIIGVAVCCCLPCIIALLYVVADEGGATKEDIEQLPRYKFRKQSNVEKQKCETGGVMIECGTSSAMEHVIRAEDAVCTATWYFGMEKRGELVKEVFGIVVMLQECCICLSAYEDGAEMRELPCGHHFHCGCVDKWLLINATCPLCKYNVLGSSSNSSNTSDGGDMV